MPTIEAENEPANEVRRSHEKIAIRGIVSY